MINDVSENKNRKRNWEREQGRELREVLTGKGYYFCVKYAESRTMSHH